MTCMTGSQANDLPERIDVLEMLAASTAGGLVTVVLTEQLCCLGCGRVSAQWQIPAEPGGGIGGHEPGE